MGIVSSQFDKREAADRERLRKAYEELAGSVNNPGILKLLREDDLDRTDGAVRACLRYCGATPGSVNEDDPDPVERVESLCRPAGIMHRPVRLEPGWYGDAFGAMLGRLKTGEIVALLPKGARGYSFRDPTSGKTIKLNSKTAGLLEDTAELFYPAFPSGPMTKSDFLHFLIRSLDRTDSYLIVLSALVSVLVGLMPAEAVRLAYGTVAPSGLVRLIPPILALLFGVSMSTLLFQLNRNLIINRVSVKLSTWAEAAAFSRVLTLPTSFFREHSPGSLASTLARIVSVVESGVTFVLGSGLSLLLSIVYLIQIAFYTPSLLGPAVIIVALQCLAVYVYLRVAVGYEHRSMAANSALSGTGTSLLKGIQKIRLAGAEDRAFARWAKGFAAYAYAMYKRPKWIYCIEVIVAAIGMLGTILIYMAALGNGVETENFMAFNTSYGQLSAAVLGITALAGTLAKILPSLDLMDPILRAEPEADENKPSVKEISGSIELNGVSFRYSEDSPWILKDFSVRIRDGEYVGIVGRSGCGKSTLIRILLGFEQPEFGSVLYGENNLRDIDPRSLRSKAIAVVLQDARLIRGDILHNIILATPNATIEDAWEAAEIAGIAEDIRKMPMGMYTMVSEGSGGISGGQRQRIIIARAVCSRKKILIMDEATSALDNITQQNVSESLDTLKCTRIVVAHRLSTVRHCDRILVLDHGEIAESGTYEELIAKNGLFAELVARQRLEGA